MVRDLCPSDRAAKVAAFKADEEAQSLVTFET
jgi:hypothetical protein